MTSVTGSSIFLGEALVGGNGIEFLRTDIDAVDGRGESTGEKLFIARTPLINAHRNRMALRSIEAGLTHGSMAMHDDGPAYVVRRGTQRDPKRVRRTPVMDVGHDTGTVIRVKHGIEVYSGGRLLTDPEFATHPAVDVTWYESAFSAAALEDDAQAQFPGMRVRMMRDPEVTCFVTWDGKYTKEQVKARAHLYRKGVTGTASVEGDAAALRTTDEGFVDAFGNVWIWTDGVDARPATGADMNKVARILRGASWSFDPQCAHLGYRDASDPRFFDADSGVRFVAVARTPK